MGWLGSLFSREPRPTARRIEAAFDAASRSPDAHKRFFGADYLSADAALSPDKRRTIAIRVRHEAENNPYCKGILRTLAEDAVGTGARLNLADNDGLMDPASLQRRERRWRQWTEAVDLTRKLKIARMSKARDGEVFLVIVSNPALPRASGLDVRLYEMEQCGSSEFTIDPDHYDSGITREVDGIIFDRYGNPSKYRFWKIHPGEGQWYVHGNDASFTVPAADVLHYANLERPGQHRGLSEMAADLLVFNDTRRYCEATIGAAEIAAQIAMTMKTTLPPDDGDGAACAPKVMTDAAEFPRKSIVAAPEGWELAQIKAEQPTQTYVEFTRQKITEAARALSMPANIARGDSSDYNYASGRLDHQTYHRAIAGERDLIRTVILNPLLDRFEQVDMVWHPEDYTADVEPLREWVWDGWEHVDPVKEATAQAQRLASGVTTLKEECAREGKDYEDVLLQIAKEQRRRTELGIPAPQMPQQTQGVEDAGA